MMFKVDVFIYAILFFAFDAKCDIENVLKTVQNIDTYRAKTLEKIISLKKIDGGWGYETPRVITSLQLGDDSWSNVNPLSTKQLEVELLSELLNDNAETPMRSGRLAMFVYGLKATCKDPSNFHNIDILGKLKSKPTYNAFELAYVSLALCISGAEVDEVNLDRMESYLKNYTVTTPYMRDYVAMLLQAMQCIVIQKPSPKLENLVRKITTDLKSVQNADGSFGNVDTTAVVTQALVRATDNNWNATAVVYYFLNMQTSDGTIGNSASTVQIYPILYAKNFIDLMSIKCQQSDNISVGALATDDNDRLTTSAETITISYSLWIGNDAETKFNLKLNVPLGITFYQVMVIAATVDSHYIFEASESSYGHYVQSINGVRENVTASLYWTIGVLIGNDKFPTPLQTGVDTFYPKQGDNVIFWYKKLNF